MVGRRHHVCRRRGAPPYRQRTSGVAGTQQGRRRAPCPMPRARTEGPGWNRVTSCPHHTSFHLIVLCSLLPVSPCIAWPLERWSHLFCGARERRLTPGENFITLLPHILLGSTSARTPVAAPPRPFGFVSYPHQLCFLRSHMNCSLQIRCSCCSDDSSPPLPQ
jgi:hypothetical protein